MNATFTLYLVIQGHVLQLVVAKCEIKGHVELFQASGKNAQRRVGKKHHSLRAAEEKRSDAYTWK